VTACRGQEIDRQRFIGLGRRVFSDAFPEVVLRDGRRIAKRRLRLTSENTAALDIKVCVLPVALLSPV